MTTEERIERLEIRQDRIEAKYKTLRGLLVTLMKAIDGMLDLQVMHETALERLEKEEVPECEI